MKKIIAFLIVLIIGVYCTVKLIPKSNKLVISNDLTTKCVNSKVLYRVVEVSEVNNSSDEKKEVEEEIKDKKEIVKNNDSIASNVTNNNDIIVEEKKEVEPVIKNDTVAGNNSKVEEIKESLTGKMSAYGPDCSGCSGYLASGRYVGDGNIYYEDSVYGKVRIVAGDRKYSYGTIVRIKDKKGEFLAIVLDRGGVGLNKKYMFDLLFTSEEEAYKYGVSNASFEILRYGY